MSTDRLKSLSMGTLPRLQVEPLRMFPNSWLSGIATTTVLDTLGYVPMQDYLFSLTEF